MQMSAYNNKFLLVPKRILLTHIIEPVIISLDDYFAKENKTATVTSGYRSALEQLFVIREYLKKLGKNFPQTDLGIEQKIMFGNKEVYAWQEGWSALLNAGIIINPPYDAECLLNSYRPDGSNRKGQIIKQSPHCRGTAFDIGGGPDGVEGNIVNEVAFLRMALADKMKGLKGIVIERKNNCLHCDCLPI